jgi:hypothetical protein
MQMEWQPTFGANFHNGSSTDDDVAVFAQRFTTLFNIYKNSSRLEVLVRVLRRQQHEGGARPGIPTHGWQR